MNHRNSETGIGQTRIIDQQEAGKTITVSQGFQVSRMLTAARTRHRQDGHDRFSLKVFYFFI